MSSLNRNAFRHSRKELPPDAFAEGPEESDEPTDIIDRETWNSIISLPDDVSIRTSSHYGTFLKKSWSLWNEWICLVGALQEAVKDPTKSPIAHVSSIAIDEIQASIYNALVGFYRLGVSALRNVLEQMTIGMHLELSHDNLTFNNWLTGACELNFGGAADKVHRYSSVNTLEHYLMNDLDDSIYRQKGQRYGPGLARRLFSELSSFTHGGPDFTNADMWYGSNGPIFVPKAFEKWISVFTKTYALGVLKARLAQPKIRNLAFGSSLAIPDLYKQVVAMIPSSEDGLTILREIGNLENIWR